MATGWRCRPANPSFARVVHQQHQRLTMSHSLWTSASDSCLQFIRFSIHCSSVDLVAGSVCTGATSAGTRPTSSIFVSILGGAAQAVASAAAVREVLARTGSIGDGLKRGVGGKRRIRGRWLGRGERRLRWV